MVSKKIKVWLWNPRANPNWQDNDNYYFWRSEVDKDLEPTPAQLTAAEAAFDEAVAYGAVSLESNKASIVGNGSDAATVTVTYRLPYPDYVTLRIAGKEAVIPFDPKGIGAPFTRTNTIDNLVSNVPGENIVIEVLEWGLPEIAGGDTLIIEVTG